MTLKSCMLHQLGAATMQLLFVRFVQSLLTRVWREQAPSSHHLGESMPRKGYKRASGRSVGMPEVMQAQNFNRRITAEEALILATAGEGSKTEGFRKLMSLYGELHNIGYRCHLDIIDFMEQFYLQRK